jgi:hypothetical protein
MPPLPPAVFLAQLTRAGVSQAVFARLAGVTARQVNNWAALLAVVLEDHSAEALTVRLEEMSVGR